MASVHTVSLWNVSVMCGASRFKSDIARETNMMVNLILLGLRSLTSYSYL